MIAEAIIVTEALIHLADDTPSPGTNPWVNYIAAAVIALISGTGGWATLQIVINRRGAKAQAAAQEAEAELKREEAKAKRAERDMLLFDVREKAMEAATKAADKRYGNLYEDYKECRTGLVDLRLVTEALVRAWDDLQRQAITTTNGTVRIELSADQMVIMRTHITEARKHLT